MCIRDRFIYIDYYNSSGYVKYGFITQITYTKTQQLQHFTKNQKQNLFPPSKNTFSSGGLKKDIFIVFSKIFALSLYAIVGDTDKRAVDSESCMWVPQKCLLLGCLLYTSRCVKETGLFIAVLNEKYNIKLK